MTTIEMLLLGFKLILVVLQHISGVLTNSSMMFTKTLITNSSRLSGCPPTQIISLGTEVMSNWDMLCAMKCNRAFGCSSFKVSGGLCELFFTLVVSAPQEGATGDTEIYTVNNNVYKDVIRGKIPINATTYNGNLLANTITTGVTCQTIFQNCWCDLGFNGFVIDMVQTYTIVEMIFTIPIHAYSNYSAVAVYVGNTGTTNDAIFKSNFLTTPMIGPRFQIFGSHPGRYITITNHGGNPHPMCLCSLEAYGY